LDGSDPLDASHATALDMGSAAAPPSVMAGGSLPREATTMTQSSNATAIWAGRSHDLLI
jgi:hypothetical protein